MISWDKMAKIKATKSLKETKIYSEIDQFNMIYFIECKNS